jgi:tetratricopeptide (TPR) repeat protein
MFLEGMTDPDSEERTFEFDYARKTGRFETSMKLLDNFIEKDPAFFEGYMQKAIAHYFMGEIDDAKRILAEQDPLLQDNYFYLLETSKLYYYMDEMEKFKNHLNAILDQFEDRPAILHWLSAVHAEMDKDSVKVNANLKILNEKYDNIESGSPAWFIALYFCHIKDYDSALTWLEKSYERTEVEITWLKEDPLLKPLKTDRRYIDLYNKIGFDAVEPIILMEE